MLAGKPPAQLLASMIGDHTTGYEGVGHDDQTVEHGRNKALRLGEYRFEGRIYNLVSFKSIL